MQLVATLHAVTLKGSAITSAVRCVSLLRRKFDPSPVPVELLMDEMAHLKLFKIFYIMNFSCDYIILTKKQNQPFA
jgi:hypothetical protein